MQAASIWSQESPAVLVCRSTAVRIAEPVELFEIRLGTSGHSDTIDPVCRMRVEPEFAAGSLLHVGERFWFCSLPCVAAFAADPNRYLISARPS